jgi:hypothetical protein
MWTELVFEGANASNGIAMAHELRSAGLTLDRDFTWKYIPEGMIDLNFRYDMTFADDYHETRIQKRQVVIRFRDPALATFYTLKWQR